MTSQVTGYRAIVKFSKMFLLWPLGPSSAQAHCFKEIMSNCKYFKALKYFFQIIIEFREEHHCADNDYCLESPGILFMTFITED